MKTKKELKDEEILQQLFASWLAYIRMMEFKALLKLEVHRAMITKKKYLNKKKKKSKHLHARFGFFAHHQRENIDEIKPKLGL